MTTVLIRKSKANQYFLYLNSLTIFQLLLINQILMIIIPSHNFQILTELMNAYLKSMYHFSPTLFRDDILQNPFNI